MPRYSARRSFSVLIILILSLLFVLGRFVVSLVVFALQPWDSYSSSVLFCCTTVHVFPAARRTYCSPGAGSFTNNIWQSQLGRQHPTRLTASPLMCFLWRMKYAPLTERHIILYKIYRLVYIQSCREENTGRFTGSWMCCTFTCCCFDLNTRGGFRHKVVYLYTTSLNYISCTQCTALKMQNTIAVIFMGWWNWRLIVVDVHVLDVVPRVCTLSLILHPTRPLFPPLWWSAPPLCSTCVSVYVFRSTVILEYQSLVCFLSTLISLKRIENRPLTAPCSGNEALRWCNHRYLWPQIAGLLHAGVIWCLRYWHFLQEPEISSSLQLADNSKFQLKEQQLYGWYRTLTKTSRPRCLSTIWVKLLFKGSNYLDRNACLER